MTDQPIPKPDRIVVEPIARAKFNNMLTGRTRCGVTTYGGPLTTDNGRDAVKDALEEAVDLWQYLTQIALERDADAALMRSLRADVERVTAERDSLRWQLQQLHQRLMVS